MSNITIVSVYITNILLSIKLFRDFDQFEHQSQYHIFDWCVKNTVNTTTVLLDVFLKLCFAL